jgi:hypothetical protein
VDKIPCIVWNSVTFTILGRVDYVNFSNDTMKTKEESLSNEKAKENVERRQFKF